MGGRVNNDNYHNHFHYLMTTLNSLVCNWPRRRLIPPCGCQFTSLGCCLTSCDEPCPRRGERCLRFVHTEPRGKIRLIRGPKAKCMKNDFSLSLSHSLSVCLCLSFSLSVTLFLRLTEPLNYNPCKIKFSSSSSRSLSLSLCFSLSNTLQATNKPFS